MSIYTKKETYLYTDCPYTKYVDSKEVIGVEGIHRIKLLSYDENKYCEVLYEDGTQDFIKSGYLYEKGEHPFNSKLNKYAPDGYRSVGCIYKYLLSNKDYSAHKKAYRSKKTQYTIEIKCKLTKEVVVLKLNNLKGTLNTIYSLDYSNRTVSIYYKRFSKLHSWSGRTWLLLVVDSYTSINVFDYKNQPFILKNKHLSLI